MDDAHGRWRDESAAKLSEITPVEYTRPQVLPDATTEEATNEASPQAKEPYVFEGESFWDAAEDEHTPSNDLDYWGMAYDENAQQTYYFAFASGKTQWTPPSHLVYPESHQVLLWDDGAQWFYIYDYVHGSSRWLDHFEDLQERGSPQPVSDDCMSQATTEELEPDTMDDRRQQILASWDEATASVVEIEIEMGDDDKMTATTSKCCCGVEHGCVCPECFLPLLDRLPEDRTREGY